MPFPAALLAVYGVNLPQTQNLLLLELCEIPLGAIISFPKFAFEFKLYSLACQIPLLIWCHPQICYGVALKTLNNIQEAAVPDVPCLLPLPGRHQGGVDRYPQSLQVRAVFSLPEIPLPQPAGPAPTGGILWGNDVMRVIKIMVSPFLPSSR